MSARGVSEGAQELARKISDGIWATYDDEFGYVTEKRQVNANMGNGGFHPDNIWSFWGQFDSANQVKFLRIAVTAQRAGTAGARELADWIFADQPAGADGGDLCVAVEHPPTQVDPERLCEVYAKPGSKFCARHQALLDPSAVPA